MSTQRGLAIELLTEAWPQPFSPRAIAIYLETLADVPAADLLAAVKRLVITGNEWRPSVGQIRREVVTGHLNLPSEADAALQAELLDDWTNRPPWGAQTRSERPDVHPVVLEAWQAVGPNTFGSAFLRAYRDTRDALIADTAANRLDRPLALTEASEGTGG